jgi:cation diffusion facilitator CzcD-associated flavoprotein CzcO
MSREHVDVLVVGAGLSGIAAAYYLQTYCPQKTYAILEGRDVMGGTWDLFRYPGVRSDSDMFTFGYSFRPWPDPRSIADGPSILRYLRETATHYGIDRKIRYGHRVERADWSSAEASWSVGVRQSDGTPVELTCHFLYMCSGYYDYGAGYSPDWPGRDRYRGTFVHPQQWPEGLDYAGKRVVIIGSGATAVTLVPAMAEKAGHVTMLQRSPTYILSMPSRDRLTEWARRRLPARLAYQLARWKALLLSMAFYSLARWRPAGIKRRLVQRVQEELGAGYDVGKHFTPRYNPWDQRLCLVPDSDLFKAINTGKASVVTDAIETFTETGIRLQSGQELQADIVVTATGLNMKLMGGVRLAVDGRPVVLPEHTVYKGLMCSDVPNLALALGYTNASWTLKCELTSRYVCRLLNYMDSRGYRRCTPRLCDPSVGPEPVLSFTSGYIQRALASLPSQGSKRPWKVYQNYLLDLLTMGLGRLDDGALELSR